MARLFVAVDLPVEERARLSSLAAEVAGQIPGARLANPDQYHLTLRFLGATAEPDVERIAAALGQVSHPRFRVAVAGVGVFPPKRRAPGVLWAGVAPADGLAACKVAVDRALGPDPDAARGFTPHVTLARLVQRGPDLQPLLARLSGLRGPPWQVEAFHLYDSETKPSGAVHRLLRSYDLSAD